jgi:drug/metabolite transporter (DMT)-like permease
MLGAVSAMLFSQAVGLIVMSVYVIGSGELAQRIATTEPHWWLWAVVTAGIHTLSLTMMFRAIEVGVLSIVAPIGGSNAAVTVILATLSGETLPLLSLIGVVAAVSGVALAAYRPRRNDQQEEASLMRGVFWALAAAVGFGVTFWLLGFQITPHLGGVIPVWMARVSAVFWLSMFFMVGGKRGSFHIPDQRAWVLILVGAGIGNLAYVANNAGYGFGHVGTVAVLASLNSAVAVLLAGVFLHERLARAQWIGVALVLAGIVLLSLSG